jgi:hypothetical protein
MVDQDEIDRPETERQSIVRSLAESLWFPSFFAFGFLFCYLLPFHQPTPHRVEVAVAGPAAAEQIGAALNRADPGAFDILTVATVAEARQKVLDRDAVAAYVPDPAPPTLFLAKANGYLLESVVTQAFTPIAARTGHSPAVVDLAPTASGDPMGTGLFYLVLTWNIPSYIVVMMLLRAVTLSRRAKVIVLVGWGAFLSTLGYCVALAMRVIPNDLAAIPLAFLLIEAVALTALGLAPFAKQFFPGVAVGIFVLLSMPSSGGAIPIQMVPGFFRALYPILPMGNLLDALRGIFYFHGAGVARPILVLCTWVVLGIFLIGGRDMWQRTQARPPEVDGVADPPVEDPSVEAPRPMALPTRPHRFGQPAPMVTGTVRTPEGDPAAGAVVTVLDGHSRQLVRTVTDHEGRYALTGLPEQFVDVVVSVPGQDSTVRRILVREGATVRQDFVLARDGPPAPAASGAAT